MSFMRSLVSGFTSSEKDVLQRRLDGAQELVRRLEDQLQQQRAENQRHADAIQSLRADVVRLRTARDELLDQHKQLVDTVRGTGDAAAEKLFAVGGPYRKIDLSWANGVFEVEFYCLGESIAARGESVDIALTQLLEKVRLQFRKRAEASFAVADAILRGDQPPESVDSELRVVKKR